MPKKRPSPIRVPSARSEDQPATRKMLALVRDELSQRMDAGFTAVRGEMAGMKAELRGEMAEMKAELRSEMAEIRADVGHVKTDLSTVAFEVSKLSSTVSSMGSTLSRMHLLLEEQRADNRLVLEGLQGLSQRVYRLENPTP